MSTSSATTPKTVFLVITKGIVCRNVLRTQVLERLLQAGVRVVVLVPSGASAPLKAEFPDPGVVFVELPTFHQGRFHRRIFTPFARSLMLTVTQRIILKYGTGKVKRFSAFRYAMLVGVFSVLSRAPFLKSLARWAERHVFTDPELRPLFDEYRPDAVVQFSLTSYPDCAVVKEARRRGIPSLGMPKGWDTLVKFFFPMLPDVLIVQNEQMKRDAVSRHGYASDKVHVVGFPIYDLYVDPQNEWTRERTCREHGLDPSRPYLLYCSEGVWSRSDVAIIERLVAWNRERTFGDASLVIRPYFGDITTHPYGTFRSEPNVVIDDMHRTASFFSDGWNPTREEVVRFINLLRYAACTLSVRSTLTLDCAVLDRPGVNIGYSAYFDDDGKDQTGKMYLVEFYRPVIATGGTTLVWNDAELQQAIRRAFEDPGAERVGRERIRTEMCYRADGKAAERLVNTILGVLRAS